MKLSNSVEQSVDWTEETLLIATCNSLDTANLLKKKCFYKNGQIWCKSHLKCLKNVILLIFEKAMTKIENTLTPENTPGCLNIRINLEHLKLEFAMTRLILTELTLALNLYVVPLKKNYADRIIDNKGKRELLSISIILINCCWLIANILFGIVAIILMLNHILFC